MRHCLIVVNPLLLFHRRRRIRRAGGAVDQDGRIGGGLNVSRALGDWRYKVNNTLPLEYQMVSPLPDITEQQLTVCG